MSEHTPQTGEKTVNFDQEFRHTYMFSQGAPDVQVTIMNWLARVLPKEKMPKKDTLAKKIAAYARGEAMQGRHKFSKNGTIINFLWDANENAARFKGAMRSNGSHKSQFTPKGGFWERPKDWSVEDFEKAIALGMIERDFHYLVEQRGRPVTDRDRWSSFIVDFGVLKNGTGAWHYGAMPESFKDMWKNAIDAATGHLYPFGGQKLSECEGYARLLKVVNVYLEHHPDLPQEKRDEVLAFKDTVQVAGRAFAEEFAERYPETSVAEREEFLSALEQAATYVSPLPEVPD